MITLSEVQVGDFLTVADKVTNNSMVAPVSVANDQLMVEAFGTYITVARINRAGRLVEVQGLRIVGHQPTLLP